MKLFLSTIVAFAFAHIEAKEIPRVKASANVVDIEVHSNNDYYGPLYIGQYFVESKVIYDTMSKYTIVVNEDATNQNVMGNYRYQDSNTSKEIMATSGNRYDPVITKYNLGTYEFIGKELKDQMCLYQTREDRSMDFGRMCVNSLNFIVAEEIIGEFDANGVLGLAPSEDPKQSYVDTLYREGMISQRVVGLNYENPLDTDQKSKISLGSIDYSEVEGGQKGINYYQNKADGFWGLKMDDFLYNNVDMTGNHEAKIGLIDSGNTSIQLPDTIYQKVMESMRKDERSIYSHSIDGRKILVARKSCDDLYDKMKNIEFMLQNTKIVIKPRGYLYHLGGQQDCFLGIESIPDSANQYRLGTVFLRNFYTALNFDQNLIMIGVNKGSSNQAKATIIGEVYNPFAEADKSGAGLAIVLILLLVMFSIAILFFLKANQQIQQSNGEPGVKGRNSKKTSDNITFNIQNDLDESLQDAESLDEGNPDEEAKEQKVDEIGGNSFGQNS